MHASSNWLLIKSQIKNNLHVIFFTFLVMSCGVSDSDYAKLKTQNESLNQENAELKKQIGKMDSLAQHSNVVIPNTELKEITATSNGQTYKIKIQLPRDYSQTAINYPVLYVTDAETNFGGITYIVQRLMKDKLIPPMIVVGIAYGTDYNSFYKLRSRDLTPVEIKNLRMGGRMDPTGGAPQFLNFLQTQLFPLIENSYRINTNSKTLYGHSYGGLFGTYVLLNQPDLFNKYLILSPSLWFKGNLMLKKVDTFSQTYHSTKVYMASGELERRIDDLQTEFVAKLKKRNFTGLAIKADVMTNETHRTIFGAGFTNGMRYLFE